MKLTVVGFLLAACCGAQTQQVNVTGTVTVVQPQDYMTPFLDTLKQGTEAAIVRQRLEIQRQYLELAKHADARAQEAHDLAVAQARHAGDSLDLRNRMIEELRAVNDASVASPRSANWRVTQLVLDAFSEARSRHSDFDNLLPAVEIISHAIPADWERIGPAEYVEALYSIARYASFAETARRALLSRSPQ